MKTQRGTFPLLLPAIAGIAVILLGVAASARTLGHLPNPSGGFGNILGISTASAGPGAEPADMDPRQAPGDARSKPRCRQCGVVLSVREIGASGSNAHPGAGGLATSANGSPGASARSYEFSVRLEGGSRHVIVDANPASWRAGERVIVIAGTDSSQQ